MAISKHDRIRMRATKYGIEAGAIGIVLAVFCSGKSFLVDFTARPRRMITLREEDVEAAPEDPAPIATAA